MRVRKIAMLIFLAISFSRLLFAQDRPEQITITTYYPSPNGVYDDLRAQHMAIGETYFNHTLFCWEAAGCTTQISERVDLVVEGKVGIGTVNPDDDEAAILDVEVPWASVSASPSDNNLGGMLLGRATNNWQTPRTVFQRMGSQKRYFGQEISWGSDFAGFLLRDRDGTELTEDDKDAVIAWGDNSDTVLGPDLLRFQFGSWTGTGFPNMIDTMAMIPRATTTSGTIVDVGIGTTTLDSTLLPRLQIQGATSGNSVSEAALYVTDSAATPNPLFLVYNSGHVGINTIDTASVLQINHDGDYTDVTLVNTDGTAPLGYLLVNGHTSPGYSGVLGTVGIASHWLIDSGVGDLCLANHNADVRIGTGYGPGGGVVSGTNTGILVKNAHDSTTGLSLTRVGVGVSASADLTHMFQVGTSGAYCDGGAWVDGSSKEFKKDIKYLQTQDYQKTLSELEKMRICYFRYKNDPSDKMWMGVIAEEAPEVMVDAQRKGFSPASAVGFLMAAVKAQQKEIGQLKEQQTKITQLEEKIKKLEGLK